MLLSMIVACDKEKNEPSDVAFFVTPKASEHVVVNTDEQCRYEMELHTTHDYISRIRISSYNTIAGNVELIDSQFTKPTEKFIYDFYAPYYNRDSVNVTLTFDVWDNAGSYGTTQRNLTIKSVMLMLPEKNGIVLRGSESGFSNALSFSQPSKTFNWQLSPDSVDADLCLESSSDFTQLAFFSKTKAKMVRINSFDYAAASALSIQNVFESSRLENQIANLKINDIILVGHDKRAQGVLHITNIIRTGTDEERSVHLSFKGIGK